MKRFLALLCVLLILPVVGVGEGIDIKTLSDEDLVSLMTDIRSELNDRKLSSNNLDVVYKDSEIVVYLTGNNFDRGEFALIECVLVNNGERVITRFGFRSLSVDGWQIPSLSFYSIVNDELQPQNKIKGIMRIAKDDANISSVDEVNSITAAFYLKYSDGKETLTSETTFGI